jgi:predicted DNA-binding transcriptional regulator AlpA
VLQVANRENILPTNLPPRGLSHEQAAAYVGVSVSLFDEMVKDGRMPKPTRINSRTVWDRFKLDEAFARLAPEETIPEEWSAPKL